MELASSVSGPGPGQLWCWQGCSTTSACDHEDKYQFKPERPFAPGGEIAGVVEAVGEGVTGWAEGDRLIAMLGHGGLAEKVLAGAATALPLPEGRSFEDGSALILTYATTIHALLDRGQPRRGKRCCARRGCGSIGGVERARLGARRRACRRINGVGGKAAGRRCRITARAVRQGGRQAPRTFKILS